MRSMKIRDVLIALAGVVFFHPAYGLIEELDLYAWQEGESLPKGWTSNKLNKAVEKGEMHGGAYFKIIGGQLKSPVFDSAIRSVTLYVSTSTPNPTRFVYLQPMRGGVPTSERIPVDKTLTREYEARTFEIDGLGADQFELNLDGSGNDGNWAIIYIIVRYGTPEVGENDGGPSGFWALSSFTPKPGIRRADFSPLGGVIPSVLSNVWQNGQTVRGFHAFYASKPCTNVRIGSPSSPGGLYVIVTNDVRGSLRALALHGTGDWEANLMLPVAIDAERRVERLCVDYRAWALGGTAQTDLNFSYRPLDDISDLKSELANEWTDVDGATWTSGEQNPMRTVDVPPDCLRDRKYICFRWWAPKQTHSSLMGVSDVRVSAEIEPSGFAVIIK